MLSLSGVTRWLFRLPEHRAPTFLLFLVNLFGTVYGYWWYREQLAATPLRYWPVVPDSPTATLLFALFLFAHLRGGAPPLLAAFACLTSVKYGLWTPVVMAHYWITTGQATFESIHLSLSHLGMALEAWIFMRAVPPARPSALVAAGWLLFNDFMDYARGFHPHLPMAGTAVEDFAAGAAVTLSLAACAAGVHCSRRRREQ